MDAGRFEVAFSPSAQRKMEELEVDTALHLARDIKAYLETSPLPLGKSRIKRITGFHPPLYRLRSGDFRAYYRIQPAADRPSSGPAKVSGIVVMLEITHKKDSEKILRKIR